jgi:hypothetical protein
MATMVPAAVLAALIAGSGCVASSPVYTGHGVVFYCDGAGGGGVTNWGPGVKKGLADAGFQGSFDEFPWETGLGVIVDQDTSVEYKKGQGKKLADQISAYHAQHPDDPLYLMGLSAGTAVAVYTLEALQPSVPIEAVVMLSGSLSSGHDLTQALHRVEGDFYVTTSQRDSILRDVVPKTGSADREHVGEDVIGVHGCHMPKGASAETRRLYSKVVVIAWNPSFEKFGDAGGHTDTTHPGFVQHVIAPLIIREGPRHMTIHERGRWPVSSARWCC